MLNESGMGLKLEEFDAYQRSMEFWRSVNALLERPAFLKDCKLRDQIANANDSIPANFAEGSEQGTDRAFGNFLYHSKGSAGEVVARLREAHLKKLITEEDLTRHVRLGDEVCRLLAGLARYLYKSNFKDRGHYKASLNDDEPSHSIKGRRT